MSSIIGREVQGQLFVDSNLSLDRILEIIREEAKEADRKAAEACKRSKYSIQDYYICIEFHLQKLHDRLAREAGLSIRCPNYYMRDKVASLRKDVAQYLETFSES